MRSSPTTHATAAPTHWAKMRESGTLLGLRFVYGIYTLFGRGIFRFLLLFVSLYFLMTKTEFRRASQDYLQRHYHSFPERWQKAPTLKHSFKHFYQFGETILDKALAWGTEINHSAFVLKNEKNVHDLLNDERGQLIIGTHFGNLEYCRGFMKSNSRITINILVYDKHAKNFAQVMENVNPASRMNVYQVDEINVAMILTLKNKIDQGEWLFIAGDRIPIKGHHRTTEVDFLGSPCAFPIGPYQLASTLGCPVKLMFAYRAGDKITVDVQTLTDKLVLDRKHRSEQIEQHVQHFAKTIEQHCEISPYQWFNFYDFWARSPADGSNTNTHA